MIINLTCIDCLRKDAVVPDSKIGRFISENLEFTEGYASGPSTSPSVATCLSGHVTGEHGSITTGATIRVQTWVQELRARGFHAVCYTENNFVRALEGVFDEWHVLPWMQDRNKYTSPSYNDIWDRIANEKRDCFFYVHLMDVHPPYRYYGNIKPDMFPKTMYGYELVQWVNKQANEQKPSLDDKQFGYLWKLMEGEVAYLDTKIEFPGDMVFLIADHGELIGETYNGGRWWSHTAKHFTEEQLHIPFAAKGIGRGKYDKPFMTRFLGQLIQAVLDSAPWPDGSELYWEDYWYGTAYFAAKHPERQEYLAVGSDGIVAHNKEFLPALVEAPAEMQNLLLSSMVLHNNHQHLYSTNPPFIPEEHDIIEGRLRALGYIE